MFSLFCNIVFVSALGSAKFPLLLLLLIYFMLTLLILSVLEDTQLFYLVSRACAVAQLTGFAVSRGGGIDIII